mmetsp:Transcript_2363/g.4275  ORF Transcript_2363/g.4275 Transcript_2363/m.4275 type:complete len:323 (-) Transcript_2363:253-1221(-)|eukprot:CAMPEP_0197625214 /NCGR_PEP_ID=MMETSP1338-20131121/4640_1 /TAXON_ID=43686 ORGANISM="Pelagodinium beii, Strain RCC1491" /NCGR_SAMPLE_ID=MMETSP1338 /ASSEMBLY_ACC=CAM_ASM_000754 /LENGTH=322 /DNA_ID=CAMNT_0043195561 /DNA_START=31 /DNA_END=999 /DNA_ORIENTATION=+
MSIAVLLAMAGVLLALPKQAFQVPTRGQRPLEVQATKPAKLSDTKTHNDKDSAESLNKLVGAVELCLGVGLIAISTGATSLHCRGRLPLRASGKEGIVVRQKAWLAPGSKVDLVGMYGVTEPCGAKGAYYWDPANLAENMNPSKLRAFRAAEIKHGRVCMLATLGWLVQEKVRIPWLDASSAPNGFKGLQYYFHLPRLTEQDKNTADAASFVLITIVLVCGYIERNASDEDRDPGDFGDPAGWYAWNQELNKGGGGVNGDLEFFRDCELNHCRLAMMGILAAASAEYSTGLSDVSLQWAGTNSFALEYFKEFPIKILPSYYY